MKKIIQKTEKEIKDGELKKLTPITVAEKAYFYGSCDRCEIAFFGDDTVFESTTKEILCPLFTRGIFKDKRCLNRVYLGSEETFNKYYKLLDIKTPMEKIAKLIDLVLRDFSFPPLPWYRRWWNALVWKIRSLKTTHEPHT